jgi:ubiquinone/menaquinone biosynthesis C-methylase UbiE
MVDHPYEANRFVFELLRDLDLSEKLVLDIGCGKGSWAFLMRADILNGEKAFIVGTDLDLEAVRFAKKHTSYDDLVVADANHLPYRDQSFDLTLACEIIEHLSAGEGNRLLQNIDRVSSSTTIVTTPNGFLETPNSSFYQLHRSGWTVADFKRRGYVVRGYGMKFGNRLLPVFPRLAMGLHYIFTPLSYVFPQMAGFLVCVKTRN